MAKKKVRIEAPIKGVLNKQVNVGDTVMVVSKNHRAVSCNRGKYLGYIESPGRYPKRAQVEVVYETSALHKPDGTVFDWRADYDPKTYEEVKKTLTIKPTTLTYTTTLNLNRIATIKE